MRRFKKKVDMKMVQVLELIQGTVVILLEQIQEVILVVIQEILLVMEEILQVNLVPLHGSVVKLLMIKLMLVLGVMVLPEYLMVWPQDLLKMKLILVNI
jgi:hypothetical protein